MAVLEIRSEHSCYGGLQGFYTHDSTMTGTKMNVSVFVPSAAAHAPVPALYFLPGLTCTDETFMLKAGAQRHAEELGLVLVSCDTSPRGLGYAGDADHWDFGVGAGFYLDATQAPWSNGYSMSGYVNFELPTLIENNFPVIKDKKGIFGHSMGGHGALVSAFRHPTKWQSVSALAPICNPINVPWGQKAFANYLGNDPDRWADWDASVLMSTRAYPQEILIDQGEQDQFLERELQPDALINAATASGQKLKLRRHSGYDHSYWFIQTFIRDHIEHHATILLNGVNNEH